MGECSPTLGTTGVHRKGWHTWAIARGDITRADTLRGVLDGHDAVVHLTGAVGFGQTLERCNAINRDGPAHVDEEAARVGVRRFVHTSTVGVHGHVEDPPADEATHFAPGDVYQATKAEAETLALRFHRERGLPVVVVRPSAIYGPGETRLLKLFRAIARRRYALVGSGRALYHPVYIDDLVQGLMLVLERPEAVGEAFIVGGPRYVSQAELARMIARHTGGGMLPVRVPAAPLRWAAAVCEAVCIPLGMEPPLHRRRVEFWTKSRAFSIEKARRMLGYEPQVELEDGIARTYAWYRKAGWL